jgi:hypothetical protein
MKKIVIAAQPHDEHTRDLVHLLGELFPECEVQVNRAEARVPVESPILQCPPLRGD